MCTSMAFPHHKKYKSGHNDIEENIQYSLSAKRHHSTFSSTSERNLTISHPVVQLSLTLNQKQVILLVPLVWNKKSFYSILVETIKELIGSEAHRCESNVDRLFSNHFICKGTSDFISLECCSELKEHTKPDCKLRNPDRYVLIEKLNALYIPQGIKSTKSCKTRIQEQILLNSCGNLISIFLEKTIENTYLKFVCYNKERSMSTLQSSATACIPKSTKLTFLSCTPLLMRKEQQNRNIVIKSTSQKGDYNFKENCISKMAINTKTGVCSTNNFDQIPGEKPSSDSNNSDHDGILPLCNQIKKQPLSDNTKISNWVRVAEREDSKNIFSTNKKGKADVNANRRRRMKILVNQTPLRQIYKTNRRRSELLDMSDLKVLHSSLGRIFVTLSALAFVTFAAGSPSLETSGK